MALPQPGRDSARCVEDDREIRLALLRQRRRECDEDRLRIANHLIVERGADATGVHVRLQLLRRDVLDVALAAVERLDDAGLDVDEDDGATGVRKDLCERDADVPRADDGDVRLHAGERLPMRLRAIRSDAWPSP